MFTGGAMSHVGSSRLANNKTSYIVKSLLSDNQDNLIVLCTRTASIGHRRFAFSAPVI